MGRAAYHKNMKSNGDSEDDNDVVFVKEEKVCNALAGSMNSKDQRKSMEMKSPIQPRLLPGETKSSTSSALILQTDRANPSMSSFRLDSRTANADRADQVIVGKSKCAVDESGQSKIPISARSSQPQKEIDPDVEFIRDEPASKISIDSADSATNKKHKDIFENVASLQPSEQLLATPNIVRQDISLNGLSVARPSHPYDSFCKLSKSSDGGGCQPCKTANLGENARLTRSPEENDSDVVFMGEEPFSAPLTESKNMKLSEEKNSPMQTSPGNALPASTSLSLDLEKSSNDSTLLATGSNLQQVSDSTHSCGVIQGPADPSATPASHAKSKASVPESHESASQQVVSDSREGPANPVDHSGAADTIVIDSDSDVPVNDDAAVRRSPDPLPAERAGGRGEARRAMKRVCLGLGLGWTGEDRDWADMGREEVEKDGQRVQRSRRRTSRC